MYNSKEQSNRTIQVIRGSNNWFYGPYFGTHRVFNGGTAIIGKPLIANRYVTHSVISRNDSLSNYVNNVLYGSNNNVFPLGAISIAGSPINGNVAELIIVKGLISNDERESMDRYLMDKYAPPVDAGPDRVVCSFPDSITLDIDYATSFQWDTGDTTATAVIDSAGKYFVTVTDVFERTTVDSVYFILDTSNYSVDFGFNDTSICLGSSIELFAGRSNLQYSWNTNQTTPSIKVDSAFNYVVSVTNCSGLVSLDSVQVNINNPEFDLGVDTTICFNNQLVLTSDTLFNNVNYSWSNSSNLSSISVNTPNQYSLTVTDELGCSFFDSIYVSIDSSLFGLTLGPDTALCKGNSLGLANPISGINSYTWSNGLNSPSIVLDSNATYILNVAKDGYGNLEIIQPLPFKVQVKSTTESGIIPLF